MLLNIEDYRRLARRRLPRFVFDYVEGAADSESGTRRNRDALERMTLLPRCLRDTHALDTTVQVFGRTWPWPVAVAPTGFNGLVRPGGDIAIARAAKAHGLTFVQSTASNARVEAVAEAAAPPWLQLYVMSERSIAEQLVRRAREIGCEALVLTVDVPVSGNRERDVRNGFRLPFRPTPRTLADLMLHPAWLMRLAMAGMPQFVNLAESAEAGDTAQAQAALLSRAMDRTLVWDSLTWLRTLWDGPLLLKGVLHAEDAQQAVRSGVDGLIVSNHGGRQLEAAPSPMEVLPAIVQAVNERIPVFADSGFRSGTDIAKALALGARAVFVGRPVLYGLAASGEPGVRAVLQLLSEQLARTMALIGAARVEDIGRWHLLGGHAVSVGVMESLFDSAGKTP
jgi:(S)-mandelate dehydrogenase